MLKRSGSYFFWLAFFAFFGYYLLPKYRYLSDRLPDYLGKTTIFDKTIFAFHVFSGILVCASAVLQFNETIRRKNLSFHRSMGKVYVLASMLCIATLYQMIPKGLCDACRPSNYMVTTLWLVFITAALLFIRNRNILLHQRMMVSSFICAAYFASIRIIDAFAMPFFKWTTPDESMAFLISDISVWLVPLLMLWTFWSIRYFPAYTTKSSQS
jgi:uncharacterized membrane protein